ncbi:alpha/beta hydrolase [Sulfodiicoccus acidiphilus]|uniref:Alpha/beta hydrolase n=1 Tax=Sulfodiicoccus acidiphilus TaxID=1670455 RepID=A0A348B478_9CREN|nr:alpha/beta hydrolase [Sulfodiicoccus acidiphilus]BBD72980.1 alpha/beta hydrolase [Sulfodiicoccus acidiphilus]GGT87582.1 alpha/beta hydrolase [Sulfodiicoccus acidiphilus]
MPLEPGLIKILEAYKLLPPTSTQNLAEARKAFDQGSLLTFTYKAPLRNVEDIKVMGSQAEIPVRLYYPHNLPEKAGLTIYYHGGGFVFGNINTYDNLCRAIAYSCNCVVASVDYRLAPENKFPAAVIDSFDVLKWARDEAGEMSISSIAVAGDSAGGNLAAVVSIMARDSGIPLKEQVLIYPATDFATETPSVTEFGEGLFLTREMMRWFGEQYLNRGSEILDPRVSPARADDLSRLPPALVITAEYDPLRDQGEIYAAKLRKAGVEVVNVRYGGQIHGFLSFWDVTPAASQAVAEIGSYLHRAFYGWET